MFAAFVIQYDMFAKEVRTAITDTLANLDVFDYTGDMDKDIDALHTGRFLLVVGRTYELTVYDSWGDGMCMFGFWLY